MFSNLRYKCCKKSEPKKGLLLRIFIRLQELYRPPFDSTCLKNHKPQCINFFNSPFCIQISLLFSFLLSFSLFSFVLTGMSSLHILLSFIIWKPLSSSLSFLLFPVVSHCVVVSQMGVVT